MLPKSDLKNTPDQNGKKFLVFIAYLQVIGIVLVVFGHSFHEYPDGNYGRSLLLYRMLYSFRMPLFLFVSGFLMVYTTKLYSTRSRISDFIKTKIKRLLLPFIVLTLVTFIPRSLMSGMADDGLQLSLTSFWKSFVYNGQLVIPYFWFLQASFILLVSTYIIITLGERAGLNDMVIYPAILLLFFALPYLPVNYSDAFSLSQVARLGIYFAAGVVYCRFLDTFDRFIPWESPIFLICATTLWGWLFFLTENTGAIIICSIAGIAMCISLAKILEHHNITILNHLIGANYMIFLLSWYCNIATQQILHHFIELPWWCFTAMSLLSGIYIPLICYRYLDSHPDSRWIKITAFLLGQSINKKNRKYGG